MSRERARKILLEAFWTAEGWRRAPAVAPDEFELAKREGLMFDPSSTDHDASVARAISQIRRHSPHDVARAFVASLSTRRLEYRSALGSYASARLLDAHAPLLDPPNPICRLCGTFVPAQVLDWNLLNFERFKWGGVRHEQPEYVGFDLEQFGGLAPLAPTDQDWQLLTAVLQQASGLPPEARASDLAKALRGVFPANDAERRIVIAILGHAGILSPAVKPSPFDQYVPHTHRDVPATARNDWRYPVSWWRGADGVRRDAITFWFPGLEGEI